MASLNEMIGILSERSKRTFDVPFQEELKVLVGIVGSKFMKDSLTKRIQDRKYFLQSVVLDVIRVDKIPCPISYGCNLRTEFQVPTPIRANGILFEYVGSADFEIPWGQGGDWKETFFKKNRYTADNIRYTFRDNYLFISDKEQDIEYVGIQYIPANVLALRGLKCDANGTCYDDDTTYLIAEDLKEPIINNILTTKLGIILPKDKVEVNVDGEREGENE